MVKPEKWESLRYLSKIEIVPGPDSKEIMAQLQEDDDFDYEFGSYSVHRVVRSRSRKLVLGNETIRFITDFPEEFKKLTKFYGGNKNSAYEAYQALQTKVEDDWDSYDPNNEGWDS